MHIFLRYDVHNKPISFQVLVLTGIEKQNLNGEKMNRKMWILALIGVVSSVPVAAFAGDSSPVAIKVQSLAPKASGNGALPNQYPSKSRLSTSATSGGSTGCAVSTASNIRAAALLEELSVLVGSMSKTSSAVFTYLGSENSLGGAFDIEGAYRSQSAKPVKSEPTKREAGVIPVTYQKWALESKDDEQAACKANFQRF